MQSQSRRDDTTFGSFPRLLPTEQGLPGNDKPFSTEVSYGVHDFVNIDVYRLRAASTPWPAPAGRRVASRCTSPIRQNPERRVPRTRNSNSGTTLKARARPSENGSERRSRRSSVERPCRQDSLS